MLRMGFGQPAVTGPTQATPPDGLRVCALDPFPQSLLLFELGNPLFELQELGTMTVDLLALSDWLAAVAVDRRAIAEQLYGRTRQPMSNYLMNPKQVPRSEAGSMAMPLGTPGGYCKTEREAGVLVITCYCCVP
jgi:hypothetical protein